MQSLGMTFRNTIEPFSKTATYRCPCCHCLTLQDRGGYEICPMCFWEDDGQDDHDADEVRGGPNGSLSLTRARHNFRAVRHFRSGTPHARSTSHRSRARNYCPFVGASARISNRSERGRTDCPKAVPGPTSKKSMGWFGAKLQTIQRGQERPSGQSAGIRVAVKERLSWRFA
jgi:hypothetical protein